MRIRLEEKAGLPDVDDTLQAVFDQGHEVGAFAKKMFPDGVEVEVDPTDFEGAIQLTQKHLPSKRPIFEATLSANGGFARSDILNPVSKNEWDLIEVKSTTSLKDVHIPDLAFQAWVIAAGRFRQIVSCRNWPVLCQPAFGTPATVRNPIFNRPIKRGSVCTRLTTADDFINQEHRKLRVHRNWTNRWKIH